MAKSNSEIKPGSQWELSSLWWCPECTRWVRPWNESWIGSQRLRETNCPRCGKWLYIQEE